MKSDQLYSYILLVFCFSDETLLCEIISSLTWHFQLLSEEFPVQWNSTATFFVVISDSK